MAYAEDLVKVSVHFSLNGGEEEAQFGYFTQLHRSLPTLSFAWDDEIQAWADTIGAKTDTWWTSFRSHCHSTTVLTHVKATHIDTTGHALDIATRATALSGAAAGGSSGGNPLPFEVSRCITMYGYDPNVFVANKRRRRGRVYLPPETVSMMATTGGRFSDSSQSTAVGNWDAYMEDVQGAEIGPQGAGNQHIDVVIASQYGIASQVEAYSVGNVPDAQRRRRRSQIEEREFADLSNH